ncbi:hypothetical protein PC116_g32985 [Phytophthora cactorum]|nr:hypothetical protein PC116_g32985 [Phytophthora cactorum]
MVVIPGHTVASTEGTMEEIMAGTTVETTEVVTEVVTEGVVEEGVTEATEVHKHMEEDTLRLRLRKVKTIMAANTTGDPLAIIETVDSMTTEAAIGIIIPTAMDTDE